MVEEYHDGPRGSLRRQRLRISTACQACRSRKAKCDGGRPACARCQRRRQICTYARDSTVGQRIEPKPPGKRVPTARRSDPALPSPPDLHTNLLEIPLTSGPVTPPAVGPSVRSNHLDEYQGPDPDPDPDQDRTYYTAHGRFSYQVAAAVGARAGLASSATPHLVPFVDAPLFGELDLPSQSHIQHFSTQLPPRGYADYLVDIYWQYIDPVEPILDYERFFLDYETLYSTLPNRSLDTDQDVLLGILNVVFALAVQRQESVPLYKRNEEGNSYFRRAWALLSPESILWKPGSLGLVQFLMLMNRYLHCTNNQQKTWMTAGLAMRIAQSVCCHLPEAPSSNNSGDDWRLKRKVWASCVALDRCVSWSLGRTSALLLVPLPASGSCQHGSRAERLIWDLELHELGNQIQLAQAQARSSLAGRPGFSPRQQEEYHTAAVHLDACLNKWENSLPPDWQLRSLTAVADKKTRAVRYLLHLRYLHSRIYLYRPMLARFYSMKSDPQPTSTEPPNLSDRLLRECAGMCIEAAQKVTLVITEVLDLDEPIGLLPWWYRTYYLHIAGANFLAAMLRSELFTESVSRSWNDVLSGLRAHQHLSTYVQQCVWAFETLSERILQMSCPTNLDGGGAAPLADAAPGCCFDNILQDIGFDFDSNFLFGIEDTLEGLC